MDKKPLLKERCLQLCHLHDLNVAYIEISDINLRINVYVDAGFFYLDEHPKHKSLFIERVEKQWSGYGLKALPKVCTFINSFYVTRVGKDVNFYRFLFAI